MAATLKCTKIGINVLPPTAGGHVTVLVEYVDPTTNPPTPGSIPVNCTIAHSQVSADLQNEIDAALTVAGLDTIDWTI
jgi:hypothetical protein